MRPALLLLVLTACTTMPAFDPGALPAPDRACPTTTLAAGTYTRAIETPNGTRAYLLVVPQSAADTRLPVVFAFHGGMGDAEGLVTRTRLDDKAREAGFVLVAPEGEGALQTWNAGNCCGAARNRQVDDVAFVRTLLAAVASETCVDAKRVFATGHSNGGMLSHRLACEASDVIAAIAPVGGASGRLDLETDPPTELYPCRPARPVPVLHLHGLADGCYRFEGGRGEGVSNTLFRSVPDTMDEWADVNGCEAGTRELLREGAAVCTERVGCAADTVTCTLEGAGHIWPGAADYPSEGVCGGTSSDALVANDVLWDFFLAHPLP